MAGLFFQQYSKLSIPIPLANLKLWLKADAGITLNGATVSVWADQSGNGNNCSQGVAINQPTYVAVDSGSNNLPSLSFDGNNFLSGSPITGIDTGDLSVFIVCRNSAATTNRGVFSVNNIQLYFRRLYTGRSQFYNANLQLDNATITDFGNAGVPNRVVSLIKKKATYRAIYIQKTQRIYDTNVAKAIDFTNGNFYVGNKVSNEYWLGNVCEIIIYAEEKTGTDLALIQDYLINKYNTPAV